MRMELLKDIIHSLIGEKSKGVVELLGEKENVNEFIIAKKLNLTINQTRNLLYKLLDEGLVSVVRKKNKKKGGWYDHFWTLNFEKTLYKFRESLNERTNFLKQEMANKRNSRFYFCGTCGVELNEEQALLQEYSCVECGQLLALKDNTKDISQMEKEVIKIEKELVEVNEELRIIEEKNLKDKERRAKAEERKKVKERDAKKKERARLAKKEKKENQRAKGSNKSKKVKKR